jgi:hypothetical protein
MNCRLTKPMRTSASAAKKLPEWRTARSQGASRLLKQGPAPLRRAHARLH